VVIRISPGDRGSLFASQVLDTLSRLEVPFDVLERPILGFAKLVGVNTECTMNLAVSNYTSRESRVEDILDVS